VNDVYLQSVPVYDHQANSWDIIITGTGIGADVLQQISDAYTELRLEVVGDATTESGVHTITVKLVPSKEREPGTIVAVPNGL